MQDPTPDPRTGAPRTVSRRTLARGAAWSLPAVVVSSAAPALSASPALRTVTTTITADGKDARTTSIVIPANARNITYEIVGGGGASYPGAAHSGPGGSGALITGSLLLTCAQPVTLWAVAGGGGPGSTDATGPQQATGYGNGGLSTPVPMPPDAWLFPNSAQGWTAGGGAGSAIAIGSAPSAGGTLIVAAGGGGGTGVNTHSRMNTVGYQYNLGMSGGAGGAASGGSATPYVVTHVPGTITAEGGRGATGATGGAGGAGGSTTITGGYLLEQTTGATGGSNGTGNYGGGDGADPVDRFSRANSQDTRVNSGGGGGGYAGGGSGGAITVGHSGLTRNGLGIATSAIGGVGGAGGAGSNFVGGAFSCITNVTGSIGQAGNGGQKTSLAASVGGPGRVTVTYQVPA